MYLAHKQSVNRTSIVLGRRLFHRIILASSSIDEVVEAALNLDKGGYIVCNVPAITTLKTISTNVPMPALLRLAMFSVHDNFRPGLCHAS